MIASRGQAHLLVREHDTLLQGTVSQTGDQNVHTLNPQDFESLQSLVIDQSSTGEKAESLNPVATLTRLGHANALKLAQWVGIIRLPGGTTVEILPKTHERPGARQQPGSLECSRALLLRMLAATDERFRVAPPAELDTARMPLLEVVLRYALEGIRAAVRRGVPHAYVTVQQERPGLRGRLDLPRQVRQLASRAHLFHVTFDEYLPDRPEARLVRLAVGRIGQLTKVDGTRRLARELGYVLDDVPPSIDIRRDFSAWRLERGHSHFAPLEALCRLILLELNPLVGGQEATAHALLFDMNKVYEAYVAHLLRVQQPDWTVETQVTDRALGNVGLHAAFRLRPDLLITLPGGQIIVGDTKWKRLKPDKAPTYDVSNADAYQMLAYSQVFQHAQAQREVCLIYPRLPSLPLHMAPIELAGGVTLRLITIDLHAETPAVALFPGAEVLAQSVLLPA